MREALGYTLDSFLKNKTKNFDIKYLLADDLQQKDENRVARIVKVSGSTVYVSMFLNAVPKEKSK
ncbi:MAG: hypothetical protein ACOYIT_03690 [Christensenellales bacterium]|jgi:hypothetical protein